MRPDDAFSLSVVYSGMVDQHTSDCRDLEENDQNRKFNVKIPQFKIQNSNLMSYPNLPKSYKRTFPFKIGTTSYIFPDHIVPNVSAIGPYVDEIELIVFESKPESLPTGKEIKMLGSLSKDLDITYNIHLPLDICLGSHDDSQRKQSVEKVIEIFNLTAPLNPTTHTLHLVYDDFEDNEEDKNRWKSYLYESLEACIAEGLAGDSISIENLSYPMAWIDEIIEAFDLYVCLDAGHLLTTNTPLSYTIDRYCGRISIYHLHGVKRGRDHHSLTNLSEADWYLLLDRLKRFQGTVSIEVFSFDRLHKSLYAFENRWNHFNTGR